MKKIITTIILIIVFINIKHVDSYALSSENEEKVKQDNNQTIEEQKELFGISDFIKEADKYKGEFLGDISLNDLLNDATSGKIDNSTIYKNIFNLFGKEIKSSITTLIIVLAIVVIHSILKSISDSLENSDISKIIYYVEYILIVNVIMNNFSEILNLVKSTAQNLVGFMNSLIPLLITLMIYTGSAITSNLVQPILLFIINFIGNIIQDLIIPMVLVITALAIVSKISDRIQITKINKFFKKSVEWFLGVILVLFVGILSLEGTLSSSIDGITAKTTKAVVSNLIPVVGKVLGDTVDTVLGCGVILKNAIGLIGVLVIIGICIIPIIKIGLLTIIYSLASAIIEPVADGKIVSLLEEMSGIFKLLFGILCVLSVLLIIGVTLVIKISNSGMMYR